MEYSNVQVLYGLFQNPMFEMLNRNSYNSSIGLEWKSVSALVSFGWTFSNENGDSVL